ncbi:MAG: AmmeMemoRadiSam system protein A [Myxococcota bacterium]
MPSTETELGALVTHESTLIRVAWDAIEQGLEGGDPLEPEAERFSAPLREPRASFVTLHRRGQLRGCVGSITPQRPLVVDVAGNAYRAAFEDPRFQPLEPDELPELMLEISVLSPLARLDVHSDEELLARLRPGIDGLVLRDGGRSGTFLPSVWKSLPEPSAFLRELRRKAGLAPEGWPETLEVYCYTVETFPAQA